MHAVAFLLLSANLAQRQDWKVGYRQLAGLAATGKVEPLQAAVAPWVQRVNAEFADRFGLDAKEVSCEQLFDRIPELDRVPYRTHQGWSFTLFPMDSRKIALTLTQRKKRALTETVQWMKEMEGFLKGEEVGKLPTAIALCDIALALQYPQQEFGQKHVLLGHCYKADSEHEEVRNAVFEWASIETGPFHRFDPVGSTVGAKNETDLEMVWVRSKLGKKQTKAKRINLWIDDSSEVPVSFVLADYAG